MAISLLTPERRQFMLFMLVGGLNTVVGYALFALFLWTGLGPTTALAAATIGGVAFNFQSIGRIVFARDGKGRPVPFLLVYAVQFAINAAALRLLRDLGLSALVAQGLMLPLLAVGGFLAMRRFVFGTSRHAGAAGREPATDLGS